METLYKIWLTIAIIGMVLVIAALVFAILYCVHPCLFLGHWFWYGSCVRCGAKG